MTEKTCCVTGHREIPTEQMARVRQALFREVCRAYEDGYRIFLSGFADGADQLFAEAVSMLRRQHPEVCLMAVIPFPARERSLRRRPRAAYLLAQCQEVIVTGERYLSSAYRVRNQYLVEHAGRVIAVYDGRSRGGTASTVRMAQRAAREIVFLPVMP